MNIGLFTTILVALAVFAQMTAQLKNSFSGFLAPDNISISVLEKSAANRLFREFKNNKEIPFNYPIDGCYARAHAMARMAEDQNITMGKVFAEGYLRAQTELPNYPVVEWGWHVAPVAYVKTGPGEPELLVFDPSLFNEPVTVEEWKNKMLFDSEYQKPFLGELYYGSRYQYGPNDDEGYKRRWNYLDLEDTKDRLARYLPFQDEQRPLHRAPRGLRSNKDGVH